MKVINSLLDKEIHIRRYLKYTFYFFLYFFIIFVFVKDTFVFQFYDNYFGTDIYLTPYLNHPDVISFFIGIFFIWTLGFIIGYRIWRKRKIERLLNLKDFLSVD